MSLSSPEYYQADSQHHDGGSRHLQGEGLEALLPDPSVIIGQVITMFDKPLLHSSPRDHHHQVVNTKKVSGRRKYSMTFISRWNFNFSPKTNNREKSLKLIPY